ncbi:MAG: hypothetical protein M0Z48_13295 [Nitrospiraceae bacterium]|nr:hypothetical protein [Nitrospiraceae bacterium]
MTTKTVHKGLLFFWLLAAAAIVLFAAGPAFAAGVPDASGPAFDCEGSAASWASAGIPCTCENGQVICDSSSGEVSSGSGDNSRDENRGSWIDYLFEKIAQGRAAAEKKRKKEAYDLNEQGNRAYERKDWETSIELYKKALKRTPDDKVIQQNLRNAQIEKQRADDVKREETAFRERMAKILALMPAAKPLSVTDAGQASGVSGGAVPFPGFTQEQWKEYLDAQDVVNRLYAKLVQDGSLSDEDASAFYAALSRRNGLWANATAKPMADPEREKLRLSLPVVINRKMMNLAGMMAKILPGDQSGAPASGESQPQSSPDLRTGAAAAGSSPNPDAMTVYLVTNYSADKATGYIETETGKAIEENLGETVKGHYDNLIGLAKVVLSAKQGGAPQAGADTADFVVSKLPEALSSRAEFAREGGRLYSKVAYRAFYKFLDETSQITGVDPDSFMKQFNKDSTQAQEGEIQWVQFGK